jgi:hypothetical protein
VLDFKGLTLHLKIAVSVVRFRPWAPLIFKYLAAPTVRTSFAAVSVWFCELVLAHRHRGKRDEREFNDVCLEVSTACDDYPPSDAPTLISRGEDPDCAGGEASTSELCTPPWHCRAALLRLIERVPGSR